MMEKDVISLQDVFQNVNFILKMENLMKMKVSNNHTF